MPLFPLKYQSDFIDNNNSAYIFVCGSLFFLIFDFLLVLCTARRYHQFGTNVWKSFCYW